MFADLLRPHKPRLLFNLFHLNPNHNGTSEFALNLLRGVNRVLGEEWELFFGMRGEPLAFFNLELRGYRIYTHDAEPRMSFDLAFKPAQIFFWEELFLMNRLAPRLSYTLQDIIALRCEYLNSAKQDLLFRASAELMDQIFTISDFTVKISRLIRGPLPQCR